MATVTRSAADSAVKLFGTVTTAADVITTAFNAVGSAAGVINTKSADWLQETRERSAGVATDRKLAIIDEVTASIAERAIKREDWFKSNPKLKAAYDAALGQVTEAVMAV